MSNSSLCRTHHCFQLVMMCYLSSCATCHRIQLVFVFCHCVLPLRGLNLSLFLTCYGGGGGGSNNKKDHAAGKTLRVLCLFCSFLFFFSKHVQNRRFCAKFGQKCVLKKGQKDHDFCLFDLFCSFCRILLSSNREQKRTKRTCRRENRKMSFAFLLLDPPSPIGYNLLRIPSLGPDNNCVQLLTALCQTRHIVQLSI